MKKLIWILTPLLFFPLLMIQTKPIAAQLTTTVFPTYPPTDIPTVTPTASPTPSATPTLPIIDLPTAVPIFSHAYNAKINSAAWSPDGKLLGVNYNITTDVWILESGTRQTSFTSEMMFPSYPIFFTTDGSVIVTSTDFGEVQGFDVRTGTRIYAISRNENAYDLYFVPLAYAGDKALIIGTQGVKPYPLDLRTGAKLFATNDEMGYPGYAFWSKDGSRIYTTDFNGFHAWNGSTGIHLYSLPGINWVTLSPDNRLFLNTQETHLELYESETGKLLREFSLSDIIYGVFWSPDSRTFAAAQRNQQIIVFNVDGTQRVLPDSQSGLRGFSPDGNHLMTVGQDEQLHIWDTAALTEVHTLPYGLHNIGWSPSGDYLLAWHPDEKAILLYSPSDWTVKQRWPAPGTDLTPDFTVAWSPNGQLAAVSWNDIQNARGIIEVFSLPGTLDTSPAPTPTPSPTSTVTPTAVHTSTPVSTATIIPTSALLFPNTLFSDDFSSNQADWETAHIEGTFSDIVNGKYVIDYAAPTSGFGWFVAPGFTDWSHAPVVGGSYEVEIQISNISSTGNIRLTLLLGVQPNYSDYTVINLFLPEGRWTSGTASAFYQQEGRFSPGDFFDNKGGTLTVSVQDQKVMVYLDHTLSFSFNAPDLQMGSVGFGIGSVPGETSTIRAEFDNLQIRVP